MPREGAQPEEELLAPPPAPRPIAQNYAWRLMFTDGWSIGALVFLILGVVFLPLGLILTLAIVTAFVGIPFAILGIGFLVAGGILGWRRYQEMQAVVDVLRVGEAALGQITSVEQNYHVEVNGRNPWKIKYQYPYAGQTYSGEVSTLNTPGAVLQAGKPAYVLYLPGNPARNSLYPHP